MTPGRRRHGVHSVAERLIRYITVRLSYTDSSSETVHVQAHICGENVLLCYLGETSREVTKWGRWRRCLRVSYE